MVAAVRMTASDRLFPFQRDGVRALVERPALLLADDMGLGKTVQAATALARLTERGEAQRALIVAPRSLLSQWRRALEEWAPRLSAIRVEGSFEERRWRWAAAKNVYLVSYETARNDLASLRSHHWDVVVLDEAQRIKNRDSATSQAMKRVPRARAWALTGTPLENRSDDLASILEFVAPNSDGATPPSLREGPRLFQRQAELQLRRRKEDVLRDLPPKTLTQVELMLAGQQRRSYTEVEGASRDRLRGLGDAASVMNVLQEITLLKQVCNFCPESGQSAKADDLHERMAEISAADHRALIFSQWTNDRFGAERIAAALSRFRPLIFTGALSAEERDGIVRRFANDASHRALILSLRAGGQGLNLQQASYVIHFDRWWNPAVENQATDRAHRLGQLHPVTVYTYLCTGTIEERIEQILCRKRALFSAMVDGVSLDLSRALSPPELFGLFGLPAPARLRRSTDDDGKLIDRGQALLEAAGWVVRRAPPTFLTPARLTAERPDEFGLRSALSVAVAESGEVADAIDAAASARGSDGHNRAVVLTAAEPDETQRDRADRNAVEVWVVPLHDQTTEERSPV